MPNNGRQCTAVLLIANVVVLSLWSLWANQRWGEQATVSGVITDVASRWPALAFGLGFVAGHWLWK